MSESGDQKLSDVERTLLIPLYIRAMESQRPGGLTRDERAEALVRRLDSESLRKTAELTEESGRAVMILKGREFDRCAREFMARHAGAAVVHIGCGLDTRFERVDDGRVEWYDLDLPDVIELRRRLVGGGGVRHHLLACSVLDGSWLDLVSAKGKRPLLFLAEGVLMYFEEAQVRGLVLTLRDRFPGAELVFDAFSPFLLRVHNRKVNRTGIGAPLHWALKDSRKLEGWGGLHLLDARYPYQYPEPRIRRFPLVLLLPLLARTVGVYQYRLGGTDHAREA